MSAPPLSNQRAIIDRRKLAQKIGEMQGEGVQSRDAVLALLCGALEDGRAEMSRRLLDTPSAGHALTGGYSFLLDQMIRLIHDYASAVLAPAQSGKQPCALTIIAAGGFGREEMAPHSDVDLAFLCEKPEDERTVKLIEAILYLLWDLGLTVGHSVRSIDDNVTMSKTDGTILTSLLESRYLWGDEALYEESKRRFYAEVVDGIQREFVTDKLRERDERHKRMGDTRYVVEPNVKEGKGGLRDLHALYWIGKSIHRARNAAELVDAGLFTTAEYRSFRRAEGFLLAVRCHLHDITGRAEDRLTFDLQKEVARRMRFADRRGKSAVERFMQYYFLQAKRVGSLTGIFLSQLEDQFAKKRARRGLLAGFDARPRTLKGYKVFAGKLSAPGDDWFRKDPVRLIEIFQIAEAEQFDIDPRTMRQADRDSALINDEIREDPRANALFLNLLAGRNDPEQVLRWMNEAGVFGRFVPDFGRVNAQMQFNMYHHYTVDEHTIRAIGFLNRIEKGELAEEHPRATHQIHNVKSRRAIFVATLLHDIAKGRGGDHSILGAEIAERVCPRLGLSEDETSLIAWLVRQHLLMSHTAFKRDLADLKTVEDFVAEVQTLDRLRQLAILTAVDIRAVGPGVWNSWKGQLLGELYDLSHERLRLGHVTTGRKGRVAAKKAAVRDALQDKAALMDELGDLFTSPYWIAEPPDIAARNLVQYSVARELEEALSVHCEPDDERGATLVTVIAADHPGIFMRIAGAIHLVGGNIIDARVHTTKTGYAVDNFLVQDPLGRRFGEDSQLERIERSIGEALASGRQLVPKLAQRPLPRRGAGAFDVRPSVSFDNDASHRFTVIEVAARDRPALLNRLARALFEQHAVIRSAHVTHYGERAADTFYVTDLTGDKITDEARLANIRKALIEASSDEMQAELEPA